ncbi:MAG: aldose 1-epimerase family protein [Bacillota bacterium]
MAELIGKKYSRVELLKYCGNIDQIASVSESEITDGRGAGIRTFKVNTGGGLDFEVLPSRCLDISSLSYKGVNLSFLSKNGIVNGSDGFLNYVAGGMLFTCGLRNVGNPCEENGEVHQLHGKIGTTPAKNAYAKCFWEEDEYHMEMGGTMAETALFGHNLYLTRSIRTQLGKNEIAIHDSIENLSDQPEDFMLLYHLNFGFPFIDENTKLIFPKNTLEPRTEIARSGMAESERLSQPIDGFFEHVYFRDVETDDGWVIVKLENEELGIGAKIRYEKANLPILTQWKSMKSGDYVLGIEPCNCTVEGRKVAKERGSLKVIGAYGKVDVKLVLSFYDLFR